MNFNNVPGQNQDVYYCFNPISMWMLSVCKSMFFLYLRSVLIDANPTFLFSSVAYRFPFDIISTVLTLRKHTHAVRYERLYTGNRRVCWHGNKRCTLLETNIFEIVPIGSRRRPARILMSDDNDLVFSVFKANRFERVPRARGGDYESTGFGFVKRSVKVKTCYT